MCYFISKKDSEYTHRELEKHYETSDACEFLKKLKNTNEVHESYEEETKMNDIQSFKRNEHRWTGITRAMKTCQTYEIELNYIDINNEGTIVLYDSKSAVSYISLNCELRLKTFRKTKVVKKDDENMITISECDDLLSMIFRRKRDSVNYLMISAEHSIKSSLNVLKEDDDLKEKELRSYTNIRSTHIMKITLCDKKVITIIHREHKRSYITRIL